MLRSGILTNVAALSPAAVAPTAVTWNPSDVLSGTPAATFTNGNKTVEVATGNVRHIIRAGTAITGKKQWEVGWDTITVSGSSGDSVRAGIASASHTNGDPLGGGTEGIALLASNTTPPNGNIENPTYATLAAPTAGTRTAFAYDEPNEQFRIKVGSTWYGPYSFASSTAGNVYPACGMDFNQGAKFTIYSLAADLIEPMYDGTYSSLA